MFSVVDALRSYYLHQLGIEVWEMRPLSGRVLPKLCLVSDSIAVQSQVAGVGYTGQAGRLLIQMLFAVGLAASDVFSLHFNPDSEEGIQHLSTQLHHIQPQCVLLLGERVAQAVLKQKSPLSALRGKTHQFEQFPVLVSEDPIHLLAQSLAKKLAYFDWLAVQQLLAIR